MFPQSGQEEKVSVIVLPRPVVPRKRLTLSAAQGSAARLGRHAACAGCWPPPGLPLAVHTLCIPSSTLRATFVQDPSRVFTRAQPIHVPIPPQRNAGRHSTGTRASPSHLEAPGPAGLAPFSSHFPAQRKLTRHSVGLCHLRCQPISKTFSVLKISCFCSAFWVT